MFAVECTQSSAVIDLSHDSDDYVTHKRPRMSEQHVNAINNHSGNMHEAKSVFDVLVGKIDGVTATVRTCVEGSNDVTLQTHMEVKMEVGICL